MTGPPLRTRFRESRNLIIVCGIVLLTLVAAKIHISRQYDNKRRIERAHRAEVAELRARGLNKEADDLRRNKTITEQENRIEERKSAGQVIAPEAYVPVWLYKGLHVNIGLAALLLLASPFLGRKRESGMGMLPEPARVPIAKRQLLACAALMGVAAWHNAPRLSHSMWGDEEFNASRFILNYAERNPEGLIEIKHRPWITTLWNMRKPTNHLGYSVFARLTHDAFFEKKTGPADPWFSEPLLRAPVFIAGLLLIPAFFWALRVWGLQPWWGLLLLVLHPWFTRFGVDGRGYGFIMLGATVMLGVLGRALQTGRWRWWLPFGFLGFFLVWSNLQGVYPMAALNLTAFVALLRRDLKWPARQLLASRWIVANILTVMLIAGYLAPCWPQLQEFMAKGEIHGRLDSRFWKDSVCAWWFGQPFHPWDEPGNPLLYAMEISMKTLPAVHFTGIALFAALLVAGVIALSRNAAHRPLLVFALGGPALMLLHMSLSGNRPYDWYFTTFLPGLFLIAAAGAMLLIRSFRAKSIPILLLTATLGLYAFVTVRPRTLLRNHPLESSRESVALYRTVTNPRHPDIDKDVLSGALAMFTEGYDPAQHRCETMEELRALMGKSDRTGKPLYVNVGHLRWMRTEPKMGPLCQVIEEPKLFDHVATLPGLLQSTTRDVFRYKKKDSSVSMRKPHPESVAFALEVGSIAPSTTCPVRFPYVPILFQHASVLSAPGSSP